MNIFTHALIIMGNHVLLDRAVHFIFPPQQILSPHFNMQIQLLAAILLAEFTLVSKTRSSNAVLLMLGHNF